MRLQRSGQVYVFTYVKGTGQILLFRARRRKQREVSPDGRRVGRCENFLDTQERCICRFSRAARRNDGVVRVYYVQTRCNELRYQKKVCYIAVHLRRWCSFSRRRTAWRISVSLKASADTPDKMLRETRRLAWGIRMSIIKWCDSLLHIF